MVSSGLQVYTYNNSWSWWQFKAFNEGWNKKLDEKFSMVQSRMNFIANEQFYLQVGLVETGKAVYMAELITLMDLKYRNQELRMEIGNNKYYYTLFGYFEQDHYAWWFQYKYVRGNGEVSD